MFEVLGVVKSVLIIVLGFVNVVRILFVVKGVMGILLLLINVLVLEL